MKQSHKLLSALRREKANSRLLEVRAGRADLQLQFRFDLDGVSGTRCPERVARIIAPSAPDLTSSWDKPIHLFSAGALEAKAQVLLHELGAYKLAHELRVEWNPRLKTCAGRADYRAKLISLNPRLRNHSGEVDRTLRHELAHLLAQFRTGRRRIPPHGKEWRQACVDLGIGDEKRCHNLPLAVKNCRRRFLYRCPKCSRDFPRVRRIRRALACLACCRKHNGGKFDLRFRLKLCSGGL